MIMVTIRVKVMMMKMVMMMMMMVVVMQGELVDGGLGEKRPDSLGGSWGRSAFVKAGAGTKIKPKNEHYL